jgi:two-component system, OmpR family, response regulator CpxR
MALAEKERIADRILIIDDDKELCELVTEYLRPEGFEVESAYDAEQGMRRVFSREYAAVVLDVMLPGSNGFEVLRQIRSQSAIPVLMLTARGEEVDRIVGLEIGADDYLPKPFNPRELVARIRAILRRTNPTRLPGSGTVGKPLAIGDVLMDSGARTVKRAGVPIELTSVEFSILEILLRSAGSIVTREDLYKRVLDRDLSPYDRSIDMHISNLRKKLGHTIGKIERIKTIRSTGYVYAVVDPSTQTEKP